MDFHEIGSSSAAPSIHSFRPNRSPHPHAPSPLGDRIFNPAKVQQPASPPPLPPRKVTAKALHQGIKSAKSKECTIVLNTLRSKKEQILRQRKGNILQRTDIEQLAWSKCVKYTKDSTYKEIPCFSEIKLLEHDLRSQRTVKQKILQHVAKSFAKQGQSLPEQVRKELLQDKTEIKLNHPDSTDKLTAILKQFGIADNMAAKIAFDVLQESNAPFKNLHIETKDLLVTTQKLEKLISNPIPEEFLTGANFEVKELLRQAFGNKAYMALKECEDNPTIRFLHEINLAMYTETPLLSAYLSEESTTPGLGDQLYLNALQGGHSEQTPGTFIEKMRSRAIEKGLFASHNSLNYIFQHVFQFWGAFTSTRIGSYFSNYDPAGKFGNNVGALSIEEFRVAGKQGKAIDVRTPSPTIGNRVAPEYRAALQAIENQKIAEMYLKPNRDGVKGYGRPSCWMYTNYQEITNANNGENQRSVAIMQLNEESPIAFRGITLSKDSPYFLDGLGHGSAMWKEIDKNTTPFSANDIDSFIADMTHTFSNDSHFTLQARTEEVNKGAGLYFHTRNEDEKKAILKIIKSTAQVTGAFLRTAMRDKTFMGREAWKIKVAAKEFAYAGIQGKLRNEELASQASLNVDTPTVVTTSACKEDIDRGFTDHIKRMWLASDVEIDVLARIISLPALMARFRLILKDRIQPLVALMDEFNRDAARAAYQKATDTDDVFSIDWNLNI